MGEREQAEITEHIVQQLELLATGAVDRAAKAREAFNTRPPHHCFSSIWWEFKRWCNKSYRRAVACATGITLMMTGLGWCANKVIIAAANERWVPKTEWQQNQEQLQSELNARIAATNQHVDDRMSATEKTMERLIKGQEKQNEAIERQTQMLIDFLRQGTIPKKPTVTAPEKP